MFCYIFININDFKNKLLISSLIIFLLLCFDTFLEFFFGYNILGYKYNGQRVQSLFGNEWVVGSYISNLLPIIICLLFHCFKKNKTNNVYYSQFFIIIFIISLAIFTATLSGERSALFSILLYIFLLIIFANFNFFHKIIIVICSIFIIIFSIINFKPVNERIFKETYTQLNIFSTTYKKDHQLIFETSYNIFKDHNKYIGVGLKGFRIKCQEKKYYSEFGCTTHPHNFYFLFLTELGIIGFLFLVFFFLYLNIVLIQKYLNIGKNVLNKIIYNNKNISIFLGVYVFIFPLKTHGNFFNNWLSIFFFLQLSLLIASYLNSLKENEKI
jgi:O-antigen ligase